MKKSRNKIILISLLAVFFIFEVSLWFATDGFPGMRENGETYAMFTTGNNFYRWGIFNLRFLEDYAMGASEEAHPYYYTHNPGFLSHFSYLLQKIGFRTIPSHTFIAIIVHTFGLLYMYLTVKEYTKNEQTALFVLAAAVFCYSEVVSCGFNTFRVWTWPLIFATLYHLKRYDSGQGNGHYWIGLIFYFLMSYYLMVLLVFLTLIILFMKLLKFYDRLSWRRLFAFMGLAIVPSILLHKLIVIYALGFDLFWKDISLTIANKVLGTVSREQMSAFYAANHIVNWGHEENIITQWISSPKYQMNWLYGEFYTEMLMIFTAICAACLLVRNKFLAPVYIKIQSYFRRLYPNLSFKINYSDVKFLIAFTMPVTINFIIFRLRYVNPNLTAAPFLVFIMIIGGGIMLSTLFTNILTHPGKGMAPFFRNMRSCKRACIPLLLFILLLTDMVKVNYSHISADMQVQGMPGYKILPKYKGHSFITNYYDSYLHYFTGEWATIVWREANESNVEDYLRNDEWLFERDRFTNSEKYQHPDFMFYSKRYGSFLNPGDPVKIFKDYLLVDSDQDFWIFDLRKNIKEG